jgi:uroporphyrin-III C-methyltransferase
MNGKAYLVGAGPGHPELITVRGLNLLRRAEVVIYDHLVARELLDEIAPQALCIFVGKQRGNHTLPQEEINQLLIAQVQQGRQVVRLKGGDPFVFGRGGEEVLALARAGMPYEIVPGVSSAFAAPAYAGIPVTQRGIATTFAIVTGHDSAHNLPDTTNWAALVQISTLVIMMGLAWAEDLCNRLIAAGCAAETPACVVSCATTKSQQVVYATLATLPAALIARPLPSPAVIVVGKVVTLAERLAWFHPDGQASGFVDDDTQLQGKADD